MSEPKKLTVSELMAILKVMPGDACVSYMYDGKACSSVRNVWLSKKGDVVFSDHNEVVYETVDRPECAPGEIESRRWYASGDGNW